MEGGAAILNTLIKNHHKETEGKILFIPFSNNNLRVKKRSYNIFPKQNKPDEHNPWPNINNKLPKELKKFILIIPLRTSPIWHTDE